MELPLVAAAAAVAALVFGGAYGLIDAALRELGDAWLHAQTEEDSDGARGTAAARLLRTRSRFSAVCLAAQVLGGVAVGAAGIAFWQGHPLSSWWSSASVFVASGLYSAVIVGGGAWARRRAGAWVLTLVMFLRPFSVLLLALAIPLDALRQLIRSRLPERGHEEKQRMTEMGLEEMIEGGRREGGLADEHAELLQNVLEFKNTVAHEVMVPRTRVVAFERAQDLAEVLEIIIKKGHSRYPVYRETADRVAGILYAKDLFSVLRSGESLEGRTVADLARKAVFFATEGQKIGALLREMQVKRVHLAIVVDEFGGTSGILTLEDILEEIVGDIRDEYDRELGPVLQVDSDRYIVDAGISVNDLQDQYKLDLINGHHNGDYDSLGGLLVDVAGHVPSIGDCLELGDYSVTVRDSDAKHVRRVEIRRNENKVVTP